MLLTELQMFMYIVLYYNISKIPACILCMEYMQLINRLRRAYMVLKIKSYDYTTDSEVE